MGTRSITRFHDDDGSVIITMYRQFDGYPEGHGKDLVEILKRYTECNGLSVHKTPVFNGPGELPIVVLWELKKEQGSRPNCAAGSRKKAKGFPNGNFYLYPSTPDLEAGQEYEYDVFPQGEGKKALVSCKRQAGRERRVIWNKANPDTWNKVEVRPGDILPCTYCGRKDCTDPKCDERLRTVS